MTLRDARGRFVAKGALVDAEFLYELAASKVEQAVERGSYKNLNHAAASLRKTARGKIKKSPIASLPGEPPHTRRGQLPRAIVYDVDRKAQSAVIGPRHSVVDEAGAAHEFGERFHGDSFEARPTMAPSLADNIDRFASEWGNSIGG